MRRYKSLVLTLLMLLGSVQVFAQEKVLVTVLPAQTVLPPHIGSYISDANKFFTVTLTNTTTEELDVYLTLDIESASGLNVHTDPNYSPGAHVKVAPGSHVLESQDLKNIFLSLPKNRVSVPQDLVEGYSNGSFGLLPEDRYTARFMAYEWTSMGPCTPVPLSHPNAGKCNFIVCYKANPPLWMSPVAGFDGKREFTENTNFIWDLPRGGDCAMTGAVFYEYNIRFVELTEGRSPEYCLEHNPPVFQQSAIPNPQYIIPERVFLNNHFQDGHTYVAQITAVCKGSNALNYVSMVNDGKSELLIAKYVKSNKFKSIIPDPMLGGDDDDSDPESASWKLGMSVGTKDASKYEYENPRIRVPFFEEGTVRKQYLYYDMDVEWRNANYVTRDDEFPPEFDINYEVQLFKVADGDNDDFEETFKGQPIFSKKDLTENTLTIPWDDLDGKVKERDRLVLRVLPLCEHNDTIDYIGGSTNVVDFAMIEHQGERFFECSDQIKLENTWPTQKKAKDFEGKTIAMGQYDLVIESIENDSRADHSFKGKGYIKYELSPLGTAHIKVQFDTLKINTEDYAYGGIAKSYSENPSRDQIAQTLFSDTGLEDLMARTSIPYADDIKQGGKKAVSEYVPNLEGYYKAYDQAKDIYTLLKGGQADIYTPIKLPVEELGFDALPVQLQITTMVFSPTWATMDVLGEFVMPETKSIASDMLLFGAPRLCISPDHIIPESGTLSLLDNFTVTEPGSGFKCTFKAPEDLQRPNDGCYIAWHDYSFEVMGLDMDMAIPKTRKLDATGKPVPSKTPKPGQEYELAVLNVKTFIGMPYTDIDGSTVERAAASWDDLILEATMDPFAVDELDGFTFSARDIAVDLSSARNSSKMGEFPKGYNKADGFGNGKSQEPSNWRGLFIGDITIQFPESLNSFEVSSKNMFFDRSGCTFEAGFFADGDDGLQASAGGFSIGVKEVALSVIQGNFDNCHLKGTLGLPLLKNNDGDKSRIGYTCQLRKQLAADGSGKTTDKYAMIFNTESLNGDYNLDLFLAKLQLEQELTYFLLEVEENSQGQVESKCELLLGGKIEIGGKKAIEEGVGFDFSIPDVHFVGMRIANCAPWESKYVDIQYDIEEKKQELQSKAKVELSKGKIYQQDGFYFDTGAWALASMSKQLGPFELTLQDYGLVQEGGGVVGVKFSGTVALVKGLDISAKLTNFRILGKLDGIDNVVKDGLSAIDAKYEGVKLGGIEVETSFCGMSLGGGLLFFDGNDSSLDDEETQKLIDKYAISKEDCKGIGKGFMAHLDISLPGNLFSFSANGGYFDSEDQDKAATQDYPEKYSWGWVYVSIESGAGINMPPVKITGIEGGFYFNCQKGKTYKDLPTNRCGLVGLALGLKIASSDGTTIKGDLQLAVCYNRKRKCLSNFTMTGQVAAVGGLINSKMTVVYENNPTDRYLQINITVDAKLDAESIVGGLDAFGAGLGSIKAQLQAITGGELKEAIADAKQGLGSKISGGKDAPEDGDPLKENPDDVVEEEPSQADKDRAAKQKTATAGASISLDFKITWRRGGEDFDNKPLWHVYLGEPEEDKRCSFVLINFESAIVTCKIGANAYLCVGNELPNNGALPPIPKKIADFLNGGSSGDGMASDNISDANAARDQALAGFKTDFGVMLGAQAYGELAIDLGIIYGNIDALAGFDISLVHFSNGYCTNLGHKPGYRGWYGRGQLYAYLGMALGVRFNLGFVNFDIPLVKAEVGGVLRFGGPSPTYFNGKVRAKLELLGGLFKLDKSYSFDVGQTCKLFHGNPLDNFMLYSDCTLGTEERSEGWKINKDKSGNVQSDNSGSMKIIDPNIRTPMYINTEAPLTEHFRLLDENELDRIADHRGISVDDPEFEKFKIQAARTFRFRHTNSYAILYEYDDPSYFDEDTQVPDFDGAYSTRVTKQRNAHWSSVHIPYTTTGTKSRHYLDMPTLRRNLHPEKFYRIVFQGTAEELDAGQWGFPITMDTIKWEYEKREWIRTVEYFFRTSEEKIVDDIAPLEDYVAIAYPSNYNKLTTSESEAYEETRTEIGVNAYLNDVQSPVICLTEDLRDKAFKKGKLYWRLLNTMGRQIDIAENRWLEYKDASGNVVGVNMEPEHKLNAAPYSSYILTLDYFRPENVVDENGIKLVDKDGNEITELADTSLVRLHVTTLGQNANWLTGYQTSKGWHSTDYDTPFIAAKMTGKDITRPESFGTDHSYAPLTQNNKVNDDPFLYIGYHSNFAFPAGWEITENGFLRLEVTTSESMIFNDPGGSGKYEGVYSDASFSSNMAKDYNKLVDMPFYSLNHTDADLNRASTKFPLSAYWHESNSKWDYTYHSDPRIRSYQHTGSSTVTAQNLQPMLDPIIDTYNALGRFDRFLKLGHLTDSKGAYVTSWPYTPGYMRLHYKGHTQYETKALLKAFCAVLRGRYFTEDGLVPAVREAATDNTTRSTGSTFLGNEGVATNYERREYDNYIFMLPAYQLPTIFSAAYFENISGAYKKMSNDSPRSTWKKDAFLNLSTIGEDGQNKGVDLFNVTTAKAKVKSINYTVYRVNAFDYESGCYGIRRDLLNGSAYRDGNIINPLVDSQRSVSVTGGQWAYNSSGDSHGTATGQDLNIDDPDMSTRGSEDNINDILYNTSQIVNLYEAFKIHQHKADSIWKVYETDFADLQEGYNNRKHNLIYYLRQACGQSYSGAAKTAPNIDDIYKNIMTLPEWVNPSSKKFNPNAAFCASRIETYWDALSNLGDMKSKEYKRYEKMYNEVKGGTSLMQSHYDTVKEGLNVKNKGEIWDMYDKYLKITNATNPATEAQVCQKSRELHGEIHKMYDLIKIVNTSGANKKNMEAGMSKLKDALDDYEDLLDDIEKGKLKTIADCDKAKTTVENIRKNYLSARGSMRTLQTSFEMVDEDSLKTFETRGMGGYMVQLDRMFEGIGLTFEDVYGEIDSYTEAKDEADKIAAWHKDTRLYRDELAEAMKQLTDDMLNQLLDKIDEQVDELMGRDRAGALRLINSIDQIASDLMKKYNEEWLPQNTILQNRCVNLYAKALKDYAKCFQGDFDAVDSTYQDCSEYINMALPDLEDHLRPLVRMEPAAKDSFLLKIKACGYDEQHKVYKNALKTYDNNSNIREFKGLVGNHYVHYTPEFRDLFEKEIPTNLESRLQNAVHDNFAWSFRDCLKNIRDNVTKNAADIFLRYYMQVAQNVIQILQQMNSIKETSVCYTDSRTMANQVTDTQIGNGYNSADFLYSVEYRDARFEIPEHDADYYLGLLRSALSDCRTYLGELSDINAIYNRACAIEQMALDSIAKADSLFALAPVEWWSNNEDYRNARVVIIRHKDQVKRFYQTIADNMGPIKQLCKNKTQNEKDAKDLEKDILAALDYIGKNGKPYYSAEDRQRLEEARRQAALEAIRKPLYDHVMYSHMYGGYVYNPKYEYFDFEEMRQKLPVLVSSESPIYSRMTPSWNTAYNSTGYRNKMSNLAVCEDVSDKVVQMNTEILESCRLVRSTYDMFSEHLEIARNVIKELKAAGEQNTGDEEDIIEQIKEMMSPLVELIPRINSYQSTASSHKTMGEGFLTRCREEQQKVKNDEIKRLLNEASNTEYRANNASQNGDNLLNKIRSDYNDHFRSQVYYGDRLYQQMKSQYLGGYSRATAQSRGNSLNGYADQVDTYGASIITNYGKVQDYVNALSQYKTEISNLLADMRNIEGTSGQNYKTILNKQTNINKYYSDLRSHYITSAGSYRDDVQTNMAQTASWKRLADMWIRYLIIN